MADRTNPFLDDGAQREASRGGDTTARATESAAQVSERSHGQFGPGPVSTDRPHVATPGIASRGVRPPLFSRLPNSIERNTGRSLSRVRSLLAARNTSTPNVMHVADRATCNNGTTRIGHQLTQATPIEATAHRRLESADSQSPIYAPETIVTSHCEAIEHGRDGIIDPQPLASDDASHLIPNAPRFGTNLVTTTPTEVAAHRHLEEGFPQYTNDAPEPAVLSFREATGHVRGGTTDPQLAGGDGVNHSELLAPRTTGPQRINAIPVEVTAHRPIEGAVLQLPIIAPGTTVTVPREETEHARDGFTAPQLLVSDEANHIVPDAPRSGPQLVIATPIDATAQKRTGGGRSRNLRAKLWMQETPVYTGSFSGWQPAWTTCRVSCERLRTHPFARQLRAAHGSCPAVLARLPDTRRSGRWGTIRTHRSRTTNLLHGNHHSWPRSTPGTGR